MSTSARDISARAMLARICSPPDSSLTGRSMSDGLEPEAVGELRGARGGGVAAGEIVVA